MLLFAPTARSGTLPPPSFVASALCVHDGWAYSPRRPRPSPPPRYVLFHHGYWRTRQMSPHGEGPWDAHNPGYGGGLQMDATFQSNYGSEFLHLGPAGKWPVSVQILVAWRGWQVQGWAAWPNTSHACGLR